MGWTVITVPYHERHQSKTELVKKYCDRCRPGYGWETDGKRYVVLKSGTAGSHMGSLIEVTTSAGEVARFAAVVLVSWKKSTGELAFKELTEFEGPAHIKFPVRLFEKLSSLKDLGRILGQQVEYAREWREQVRQARQELPLAPGNFVKFDEPLLFRLRQERVMVSQFKIEAIKRNCVWCIPLGESGGPLPFIANIRKETFQVRNWQLIS